MRWVLGLVALAFLAVPPAVGTESAAAPAADCVDAVANPPCGYISATVNIDIEDKKPCRKADHSDCSPVPERDQSKVFQGKLQYYWKLSEDGTYPPDPTQEIEVSFAGVSSNPKWLTIKVEPATFTITAVDLLDPNHLRIEEGTNIVYYWYERDITVTLTHSGDPTQDELDRIANKYGVANAMLKVRTSANEPYFKEGFGTEDFRFDATSMLATVETPGAEPTIIRDDQGHALPAGSDPKEAPAGGFLAVLAGLGVALFARRRPA